MQVYEVTEQLMAYHDKLTSYAAEESLWQDEVKETLTKLEANFTSIDDMLQAMHEAQRINQVFTAGLENAQDFLDELDGRPGFRMWEDIAEPPADRSLQESLAEKLYFQNPQEGDKAYISMGDESRYLALHMIKIALEDGTPFNFYVDDPLWDRVILNHLPEENIEAYAQLTFEAFEDVTKRISSRPILPDYDLVDTDSAKQKKILELTEEIHNKILRGEIDFALTKVPSARDAKVDGFEHDEYVKLFFEMCDQPWDHIDKAHRKLIEKLNKTKTISFANDDGTDITMELVDENGEDFTFCNSLIARNIPGSEVFSAPRVNSVNGTIVAEGKFNFSAGKIIENLTMHFKDGYLESFEADSGGEYFQEFLDRNEGNRYVGELGIGTNPHLKRHVLNGLLVEKIGGSFHLALGKCYQMNEYGGEPVYVDNGNKNTTDHWDITTILYGKGGTIEVDGELIMKDGKFLDPDLAVLNEGWAAVPVSDRPDYWKSFKGYGGDGNASAPDLDKPQP